MPEVRKRVLDVVEDSNVVNTLKMLHPEKVRLRWEKVVQTDEKEEYI